MMDGDPRVARTGIDGVARFASITPGFAFVQLLRCGEDRAQVREGEETALTLRVHEGLDVRGTVVDATGAPVGGARIWLTQRYGMQRGHFVAESDARGEFRVPWVSPDQHL